MVNLSSLYLTTCFVGRGQESVSPNKMLMSYNVLPLFGFLEQACRYAFQF